MATWISRRAAAIGGAFVLVFVFGGTAGAAGALLQLGVTNTMNATTALTGTTTGPELRITNKGGGPALALGVTSGTPAFTVNSGAKIAKLNADRLDGLDGTQLQRRVVGTCAVGSTIAAVAADGSVSCRADQVDGGNAATLGGLAPNQFMRAGVEYRSSGPHPNPGGAQSVGSAACPAGYAVVGGGVTTTPTASTGWNDYEASAQVITASGPNAKGTGWSAAVTNHGTAGKQFHVYAICLQAGP